MSPIGLVYNPIIRRQSALQNGFVEVDVTLEDGRIIRECWVRDESFPGFYRVKLRYETTIGKAGFVFRRSLTE